MTSTTSEIRFGAQDMVCAPINFSSENSIHPPKFMYICGYENPRNTVVPCMRILRVHVLRVRRMQYVNSQDCVLRLELSMAGFTIKIKLVGYVGSHIDFFFILFII